MNALPPLLQLAAGRKVRPARAPAVRPKEISLHMAVAKLLRDHCLTDWQHFHVPNGEIRDNRAAAKLKAMGVRRGIPDFILVPPTGQLHCLELKRLGCKLTEEQAGFRLFCIKYGIPYVVASSIDEVLIAFGEWRCTRLEIPARCGARA